MNVIQVEKLKHGDVVVSRARVLNRVGDLLFVDFGNGKTGQIRVDNEMFWEAFERYEAPKPATDPGTAQR